MLHAQVERPGRLLLDQADSIADQITLTLLRAGPGALPAVAPDLPVEVRVGTREQIRLGIEGLAGVCRRGPRPVELWRETGRRRARQSVPMELILNAHTLGTRAALGGPPG